jgi:RecA/RadA recombinase
MAPKKLAKQSPVFEEVEELESEPTTVLNIEELKKSVLKQIGLNVFEPEVRYHLKLKFEGAEHLHRTIANGEKGIPYGKIFELSGEESHGKSLIQKLIEGEAQRDGAVVVHGDIEDSDDPLWNAKLGVDNNALILIKPKMIWVKLSPEQKRDNVQAKDEWKEKSVAYRKAHPFVPVHTMSKKRPQSAEEIFEEIEAYVERLHEAGVEKMVIGIDSLANLTTEMQLEAGTRTNMRTNNDFPMFLSQNLKRWQIMAANFNILVLLINQIREKPGVMFGDPKYEPGGRALRHNCHSRNRARRAGDGKLYQAGKLVGIRGVLKNHKNKTGEGSLEGQMCEYKVYWDDRPLYERVSFSRFTAKPKVNKDDAE